MSERHQHYCPKCKQVYNCVEDRSVDASQHGGPAESVCFHHYGVPHVSCSVGLETGQTVVLGGYDATAQL